GLGRGRSPRILLVLPARRARGADGGRGCLGVRRRAPLHRARCRGDDLMGATKRDERKRSMTIPLSRNRNFRLLWGSQVLSEFGLSASTIAFPLLVLAVTGSAVASGLVLSTVAAAEVVAGLPMGALADRWDRKKIMLGCEAALTIAGASLVTALLWGRPTL